MGNKPRIRFKGFTEDWEQRKVNEIFKVTRGQVLAASLTTPKKNRGNIYPVYSSQTKDNGLLGYYSEYLFENAITWTTDGANAGTVNFRPGRFYSTNVNGVLINENGYACYAVSEIINKVAYKYVSKVGNPKLMNNVMAEINIMITPDIDELKQISKLIEAYNQYITLHQCKLEKLKLTKKALLQKLFPKNGKHIPEIRFKGFTDAWEQCKLGDLAEIVRGASPRPISDPKWFDNDSNVGWLRIADVTAQDGRIRYLEQKISELGQEKTRVIKTPHLLLSIAATVGKPVINYVPTGVHDGFLIFLNPKFNILYAFWWLEMFREKWNKYGQPGSQVNLNSDLVKNQVINIPNEKEQEKISSFLESLDKIITLHQQEPFLYGNSVNGGVKLC